MTLERRQQDKDILIFIDNTLKESNLFLQHNLNNLQIQDYVYSPDEAIEELGLDSELINQLVEDYVSQILKSKVLFLKHLNELQYSVDNSKELDYTPLRELAHKNLGVAKNLRIEDGIKILDELMKKDDLAYLILCVEGLAACAVRLRPKCAYQTIKLIDLKSSL
ncbi:hypothetical protein SMGD1_2410 [Sulfurimonas gotlandica GD1]|jgi:hypothetical protein|uniref:HPt domain-containing protein n=1 Tax=Sulfurimonas gotlandica (strain DSM 19862 / JCM 16533 / GD1) TaxID=929558 RepID=B6BN65_SULGG|nr:hypothetical protein [Sulfurimonas gotlandica]EDZ61430.1 conserved hypothetical protein [Sulfurimonas gotlandica GD1]EHP30933.1 hypothetical protein SMGD1_2410 [Sulfurimonas gotlandica GD1]